MSPQPPIRWCRRSRQRCGTGWWSSCSAGNIGMAAGQTVPGYGGITSPANAPSAITVGAIRTQNTTARTDDLVADYSSRGPTWYDAYAKPDLVAPGHQVLSATDMASDLYRRRGHSDLETVGTHLHLPERHEHGGADRERHGGVDARGGR